MKRKHKNYSRPKTPFEKNRIDEEAGIKEEFGLKSKREIWKANAKIKKIREKAKKLIPAKIEDQKIFFESLNKLGLKVSSIPEVLSLDKKDFLNRRLQTIVFKKKIAHTVKEARQLITHKKIVVGNAIVDKPSYIVPVELENKISLKEKTKKQKEVVQQNE